MSDEKRNVSPPEHFAVQTNLLLNQYGWVLPVSLILVFAMSAFFTEPTTQSTEAEKREENINNIANNLVYFTDDRTDLCFAYTWQGMASGGPGITAVPCASIPPELLQ
jgi:hypothetical protein